MTGFSYQLYSSRNFPPLSDTLRMLAELGYSRVEGYGGLYSDPAKVAELKAHLGASGLTMPTGHFSLEMVEREPGRVLEIADALGIGTIYCPFLPPDQRPDTGGGYQAFGKRLQDAGAPIRDAGLGFGWHNHAFEFEKLADGTIPQVAIFEGGPDLEWEADLAWVIRGGADPFQWVRAFADRITAVHVKDIAPLGQSLEEDGWTDVGQGTVPWPGLLAELRQAGVRHFIMEHDNPRDDRRFAEVSLLAAKGLLDREG